MPPTNSGVSLESLPDPLIGRIFAQAGREEGVSAAGGRQGWGGAAPLPPRHCRSWVIMLSH